MTQTAINYAKALYQLSISKKAMDDTKAIYGSLPELKEIMESPVVLVKQKHQVIDVIFPEEVRSFLKLLCDYQMMNKADSIFEAYHACYKEQNGILEAVLSCVTPPEEAQRQQMTEFLKKRYHAKHVILEEILQPDLFGGFILRVGNEEFDWSLSGRMRQLEKNLTGR